MITVLNGDKDVDSFLAKRCPASTRRWIQEARSIKPGKGTARSAGSVAGLLPPGTDLGLLRKTMWRGPPTTMTALDAERAQAGEATAQGPANAAAAEADSIATARSRASAPGAECAESTKAPARRPSLDESGGGGGGGPMPRASAPQLHNDEDDEVAMVAGSPNTEYLRGLTASFAEFEQSEFRWDGMEHIRGLTAEARASEAELDAALDRAAGDRTHESSDGQETAELADGNRSSSCSSLPSEYDVEFLRGLTADARMSEARGPTVRNDAGRYVVDDASEAARSADRGLALAATGGSRGDNDGTAGFCNASHCDGHPRLPSELLPVQLQGDIVKANSSCPAAASSVDAPSSSRHSRSLPMLLVSAQPDHGTTACAATGPILGAEPAPLSARASYAESRENPSIDSLHVDFKNGDDSSEEEGGGKEELGAVLF